MPKNSWWALLLGLLLLTGCGQKKEAETDEPKVQETQAPTADQLAPPDVPAFPTPEGEVSFQEHVAPLLMVRCGRCHINFAMGKYSMTTFAALKKGGESGEALSPGDPSESVLFKLVEEGTMPNGSAKLADSEIETLKRWITAGAKYDGKADEKLVDLAPEAARQMVGKWEQPTEAGGAGPGGGGPPGGGRGPGGPGRGGPGGGANFLERMMENDQDGDGKLSGDEIPERMRDNLERVDTNEDGAIDKSELEEMMNRFRERGPGGRGGRRPRRPAGGPEV